MMLPQSVRTARGSDYWDSDTGDTFQWQRRLELSIENPGALERSGEPVEIPLDHLPWAADEVLASLRVVDPSAAPDEPRETGGNDLPYQIDQTKEGRLLVFQVDCPSGQDRKRICLYASPGQAAPPAHYASDLEVKDLHSALRLSNARLTVEVGSYLDRVWLDGKQVLDAGWWNVQRALATGQSAGHRGARVRRRELTCDGPVRKRLHLETDCDASQDPQAVRFSIDIDLYRGRPDLRIGAVIAPQNVHSPTFRFTAAVSPDGDFEEGRTRYACLDARGKPFDEPFLGQHQQVSTPGEAQDATAIFDSVTRARSVVMVAGTCFDRYVFLGDTGRVQVQYRPLPSFSDDELRWAQLWIGFLDGGPELLESYAKCRREPLRAFLDGNLLATPCQRPGLLRRGLEVDLTRLVVHVRGDTTESKVEAWDWLHEAWMALNRRRTSLYEVPRSETLLDPHGRIRLRVTPAPQGVYLLGVYPGVPLPLESRAWLRDNSLAYREGPFRPDEEIWLAHGSHRVEWGPEQDGRKCPSLDGEPFLAEPVRVEVRGQPVSLQSDGQYRDPWGNPIRVEITAGKGVRTGTGRSGEAGAATERDVKPQTDPDFGVDRLRIAVRYTIEHPQETWSNVSLVFRPTSAPQDVESLGLDPLADSYWRVPSGTVPMLEFCRFPLLSLRCRNRQYLCFLDPDQSNLMFRSTPTEAAVEYWAWPNERGHVYRWTFEVVPGYGSFANAVLRALEPHTAGFRPRMAGCCSYPEGTRRPAEAFEAGVRHVIYNEATYREGIYFQAGQSPETTYDTPLQKVTSYRRVIADVRRAHEHGLKVLFVMHFSGISSPVIPDFFDALVQNRKQELVKIGWDGLFATYWGNPNPDLSYGRGLLDQTEGILNTLGCDGIAMDRCDRLDNLDGTNLFDLGRCDGSATPAEFDGVHRPCSSLALQARRFWLEMRERLDRHGALWIANRPRTLLMFRLADAVKADIHHSPWNLFFLRAMSNGKTMFVHSQPLCRGWSAASEQLAGLVQAQSVIEVTPNQPIHQAAPPRDNTRLLYIVPSEDPYPRYWLFYRGGAVLDYDPTGDDTAECYQGSHAVEAVAD